MVNRKGFTWINFLVVLILVAIIAAMFKPVLNKVLFQVKTKSQSCHEHSYPNNASDGNATGTVYACVFLNGNQRLTVRWAEGGEDYDYVGWGITEWPENNHSEGLRRLKQYIETEGAEFLMGDPSEKEIKMIMDAGFRSYAVYVISVEEDMAVKSAWKRRI